MLAPRPVRHYWTDDEFNLLARCRAHHWTFDRIQKTHFSSLTQRAVFLAHARFKRFRVKERSYRASLVDTSATTPRSTSRREESTRSDHTPEPSSSSHTTPQPDGTIEVTRFSASRHKRKSTLATTVRTASRYNLRPSRRKSFQNTQSRVTVDRTPTLVLLLHHWSMFRIAAPTVTQRAHPACDGPRGKMLNCVKRVIDIKRDMVVNNDQRSCGAGQKERPGLLCLLNAPLVTQRAHPAGDGP